MPVKFDCLMEIQEKAGDPFSVTGKKLSQLSDKEYRLLTTIESWVNRILGYQFLFFYKLNDEKKKKRSLTTFEKEKK